MRLGIKSFMVVLSVVFGALLLTSGTGVGAQESDPSGAYVGNQPEVLNSTVSSGLTPAAQPGVASNTSTSGALAFTGGDVVGIALIGGIAVLVGGLLVMSRRRSTVAV